MGRTRFSGPIRSTAGFEVGSGTTNTMVIDSNGALVPSNGDQIIKLGDAAGARKVSIRDSANVEVASINSDGAVVAASQALGGGTAVTKIAVYTPSLTPMSVAAATTAEQTFTVTGLTTADKVIVNGPAPVAGTGIVNARVSTADTLAIAFANVTAGALTPVAGTYTVIAFRS